jgi:hypothetical protein
MTSPSCDQFPAKLDISQRFDMLVVSLPGRPVVDFAKKIADFKQQRGQCKTGKVTKTATFCDPKDEAA